MAFQKVCGCGSKTFHLYYDVNMPYCPILLECTECKRQYYVSYNMDWTVEEVSPDKIVVIKEIEEEK